MPKKQNKEKEEHENIKISITYSVRNHFSVRIKNNS